MRTQAMNYINIIFQENKANISLINKPITESLFQYLLTKETEIVVRLNLHRLIYSAEGGHFDPSLQ